MQKHGYIDEFEEIDDHRSGKIVVQLNGRINKCGVISPRFNVQLPQIENWVNLLLPARSFGYIILTTSAGIMDHEEARRKHVAGKVGCIRVPVAGHPSDRVHSRRFSASSTKSKYQTLHACLLPFTRCSSPEAGSSVEGNAAVMPYEVVGSIMSRIHHLAFHHQLTN